MRTIAVVTGSRADYGIYRPLLSKLRSTPDVKLRLMVCGAHLSQQFGHTVDDIIADGHSPADRIETLVGTESPQAIAQSIARGVGGFAAAFARERPDLLLLLGDRYEMMAAAMAALPFALPLAHIHGGEATEGMIDEAIRHSLTKMSHLHFVSTEAYAKRVIQMGECPDRVFVSGAPGLDNLREMSLLSRRKLEEVLDIQLDPSPLLVTFHPTTLEYENTGKDFDELLAALAESSRPIIFTYPNADTHGEIIIRNVQDFALKRTNARVARSLGTTTYFSLMSIAAAIVGNSSSGIIEAASFELPVVNIGNRQRGRIRGRNVIDCAPTYAEITAALDRALDPDFRATLSGMANPYGDGHAAERIVPILRSHSLECSLLEKRFYDLETT